MVLRFVLGSVYTAMAIGQLASFRHIPTIRSAYGLVSGGAATMVAVAMIAGELVCGACSWPAPGRKPWPR